MALTDNVVWNDFEQVTSDDLNDLQSLSGRLISETVRAMARQWSEEGNPTERTSFGIASGLKIASGGTSIISVGTGLLAQQGVTPSPPDVPTPEALDSSVRVGLLLSSEALTVPSRGVDTYWLVQGRVERAVTLSESREIFNPSTGLPSPQTVDKRQESQVVVELKEGTTTTIPAPDTGWVRVGAALVTVAGSIVTGATHQLATQFSDLAPHIMDTGVTNRTSFVHRSTNEVGEVSIGSQISFSAELNGRKAWIQNNGFKSLRDALFIDTNDTGSTSTDGLWWYLYLCAPTDYMPSNMYSSGSGTAFDHRGLLIASRTRPTKGGLASADLGIPLPIGGTLPKEQAAFMGVFKANGTGANTDFIDVTAGGFGRVAKAAFRNGSFTMNDGNSFLAGAYDLAILGASSQEDVPYGVQLDCYCETPDSAGIDASPPPYGVKCTFRMTNDSSTVSDHPIVYMQTDGFDHKRFLLSPEEDSLSITLAADKLDAAGATDATSTTASFEAGILGIRF